LTVFHRPLVLVGTLTAGDFALWNWSLSANHDVLALIAGVTLLPLAATGALLFALTALQLASRFSRHPALYAALRRVGTRPRLSARATRGLATPGPATERNLAPAAASAGSRAAGPATRAIPDLTQLDDDALAASAAPARKAKPPRKLAA
jgi:hypothetical protein